MDSKIDIAVISIVDESATVQTAVRISNNEKQLLKIDVSEARKLAKRLNAILSVLPE